jgi:hypothetical protein
MSFICNSAPSDYVSLIPLPVNIQTFRIDAAIDQNPNKYFSRNQSIADVTGSYYSESVHELVQQNNIGLMDILPDFPAVKKYNSTTPTPRLDVFDENPNSS